MLMLELEYKGLAYLYTVTFDWRCINLALTGLEQYIPLCITVHRLSIAPGLA